MQQIVDYRARAGAGAAILTRWSRVKTERLENTARETSLLAGTGADLSFFYFYFLQL